MNATTTYTQDGIVLHPDALRALLMFIGDDPTRVMLQRIFIDEQGHLTATDGHTLMRLASIDPGGQNPRDRAGTRWTEACAETALASVPKIKGKGRAEQHARLRVCLRWDDAVSDEHKVPPTARLMDEAAACNKKADDPQDGRMVRAGKRADGWSMQWRYMRRLADACELLVGKDCSTRGPALVNNPRPLDPMLFELPWYEPYPSDPKITYLDPKMRRCETVQVPEPTRAADVVIMPLRV